MNSPRITVAMSVYNSRRHLAEAVDSILAQSLGDFEFLIVDDGSTDGSDVILAAYADRDPRIRLLRQENRGLIASLNRIIGEARAPIIARMDADDISLPQRFERQIAFLDTHPDHGVVGSWTQDITESGEPYHDRFADPPTSHEGLLARLDRGPLLPHSSTMMRTELIRAVGGYRPLFRHCEDYDLWLRLLERTRLCNLPERLVRYRHSLQQVSTRHALAQQIGAAIAYEAHIERAAGRPDPTEGLKQMPPLEALDSLFGRPGLGREIQRKVALGILHSPAALRGEGFDLLMAHVRDGGPRDGLWRAAARLLKLGEPARALRLAAALTTR
jgi:hypothetical protein